jgi:hypothetical protein
MIGIIQRSLIALIEELGGTELKCRVLKKSGVEADRRFDIDKNYSDEECIRLLQTSLLESGLSEHELNTRFAKQFIKDAKVLFPTFFAMHHNSEDFMLSQAKIHAVLAAGIQEENERKRVKDKFSASRHHPGCVDIAYNSPNQLCGIFIALAHAVAEEYDDQVVVTCRKCKKRGDQDCQFRLSWPSQSK